MLRELNFSRHNVRCFLFVRATLKSGDFLGCCTLAENCRKVLHFFIVFSIYVHDMLNELPIFYVKYILLGESLSLSLFFGDVSIH